MAALQMFYVLNCYKLLASTGKGLRQSVAFHIAITLATLIELTVKPMVCAPLGMAGLFKNLQTGLGVLLMLLHQWKKSLNSYP